MLKLKSIARAACSGTLLATASLGYSLVSTADQGMTVGTDEEAVVEKNDANRESSTLSQALVAIEDGRYDEAIDTLLVITTVDSENAEAFNQLGYANSRLQNYEEALTYYHRALNIDPNHAGAHAYLGKVYLEMDDLIMAEHHLGQLDLICLFGCEPFYNLKEAISLYRSNQNG